MLLTRFAMKDKLMVLAILILGVMAILTQKRLNRVEYTTQNIEHPRSFDPSTHHFGINI